MGYYVYNIKREIIWRETERERDDEKATWTGKQGAFRGKPKQTRSCLSYCFYIEYIVVASRNRRATYASKELGDGRLPAWFSTLFGMT